MSSQVSVTLVCGGLRAGEEQGAVGILFGYSLSVPFP